MEGFDQEVAPAARESDVVRHLDEVVSAARAHGGLIVLRSPDGLRELAARSDRRRNLLPPVRYVRSLCERVFAEGKGDVLIDVGGFASRRSFVTCGQSCTDFVLVECIPLNRGGDTIAVVVLEAGADQPPPGKSPSVQVAVGALAAAVARRTAELA